MHDDRPVWVTIPTIGHSELLIPLVNEIERDRGVSKVLLTVNQEKYVEPIRDFFRFAEPFVEIVETWPQGKSLYHGWNTSIEMARSSDAWLAVFNDDIRLTSPEAVSHAAWLLSRNPEFAVVGLNWLETPQQTPRDAVPLGVVHGSYRHHGVGGFAWVCDPHKVTFVPDDFVWWYGDDHVFLSAERDGHKLGIASHAHVEHVHALTANSGEQNWTHDAIPADTDAFHRIWPGR